MRLRILPVRQGWGMDDAKHPPPGVGVTDIWVYEGTSPVDAVIRPSGLFPGFPLIKLACVVDPATLHV